MTNSKLRGLLYKTAKYLGDYNSIRKGTVVRRAKNRIVGRMFNRWMKW